MKPTVLELEAMVRIVDCGSITAAAARLRVPKSVVSKRLAALEAKLGASLFRRAGRSMTPTDAGLHTYERAVLLLPQFDALVEEVAAQSGDLRGLIQVAAPLSFGNRHLSALIVDFMQRHPAIEVRLDLDDRHVDIASGRYDVAFRIGRLEDSALRAKRIASSRRGIFCSPEYASAHGVPTTIEALESHSCLGYDNASSRHIWRFEPEAGGAQRALSLPARFITNSGEALLDAAVAGLGLAALPRFIAVDMRIGGRLIEVELDGWTMVPDTIYAIYAETFRLPLRVRSLIDHVSDALRDEDAGYGTTQDRN